MTIAEAFLDISKEAVEKADLAALIVMMLARIRQLELDVEALRKAKRP